jgi:hypothetical protein
MHYRLSWLAGVFALMFASVIALACTDTTNTKSFTCSCGDTVDVTVCQGFPGSDCSDRTGGVLFCGGNCRVLNAGQCFFAPTARGAVPTTVMMAGACTETATAATNPKSGLLKDTTLRLTLITKTTE